MKNKQLYIAYGSNINLQQMAYRCPHSRVAEHLRLRILSWNSRRCDYCSEKRSKRSCSDLGGLTTEICQL